jgi:hypothetical protein
VPIEALCCFDTVGNRGIPKTGVLGILRSSPTCFKKHEFRGTSPGESKQDRLLLIPLQSQLNSADVENFFHALALHENRKPFAPTLAHIPARCSRNRNFKQVWFPGTHHDLGKDHINGGGGLLTCVLAWMVSELVGIGIPFEEEELKRRFPRYGLEIPIDETGLKGHNWLKDPVHQSKSGIWRLTGHQKRTPGQYSIPGMKTNEAIHVSARLRNFGGTAGSEAVHGYKYVSSPESAITWIKVGSWEAQGSGLRDRRTLMEAPISAFEATLLGLALPAVVEPPARLIEEQAATSHAQEEPPAETNSEAVVEPTAHAAANSADGGAVEENVSGASNILGTEETEEPRREPSVEAA